MPRRLLPVLGLTGVVGLSACATGELTPAEVASAAEDALEQEVGTRPDISCEKGLPPEADARTRCVLTAGEDDVEYGVTVTVIGADDLRLEVEVDDAPLE